MEREKGAALLFYVLMKKYNEENIGKINPGVNAETGGRNLGAETGGGKEINKNEKKHLNKIMLCGKTPSRFGI
jgi:hypothetical protein